MAQKVKCDKCGMKIFIKLKKQQKGDLEYQYFTCKHCNTSYAVSYTHLTLPTK